MSEYRVVNPASGLAGPVHPLATDAELDAAMAAADAAHRVWSSTPVARRAAAMGRLGALHSERRRALAETMTREMGKPISQSLGEIDFCARICAYYAEHSETLTADEPIRLERGGHRALLRRQSVGVLLGIMPWNYPYYQAARFTAPNLILGNTIVLKHASQCPESAALLEQLHRDAGFPAGAYVNVYANADQIRRMIADPRIRGVSLTGSERAGSAVAEAAGKYLKKVVLELGGSDPFLLLSTDNMDATVQAAVAARISNNGQACSAAKRFIVLENLYDEFLRKFTAAMTAVRPADPNHEDTVLGPLSSVSATRELNQQVQRAVAAGARVAGGGHAGNYFNAAVLTGVTPANPAYREEFFGPVAAVYKAASEADAVRLANDTPFGLGSYVFSVDREQALRVAGALEAGMVFINTIDGDDPALPFGGIKQSGFGRELGRLGASQFVNEKLIFID